MAARLPVPDTPAGLTPEWLTAALRASGLLRSGHVEDVRQQRVGQDYGFTGVIVRLELDYTDANGDLPRSVVAKLPMARDATVSGYRRMQEADAARRARYFARSAAEARFYREIGANCAPTLLYAATEDERRRVVILLEDVGDGRQGDVLRGCTVDEAGLVLDELATLHAEWWDERATTTGFPSWTGDPADRQERYAAVARRFLERAADRLPPVVVSIADRLRSQLAAVAATLDAGPRTLIHADVHLDNIVFSAPGAPRPVTLLDWQTVSSGPPAWDLAMFLAGSLTVEDRRTAEAGLFDRYLTHLSAAGVTDYSLERLRLDYRYGLLLLFAGTAHWFALLDEAWRHRASGLSGTPRLHPTVA